VFLGFPPPRAAARRGHLATVAAAERAGLRPTLIWHEAPHRLAESLADMAAVLGDRPAAVARELTKRFEEVRRAGLAELAAHYAVSPARGEVTVVVGPAPETAGDDATVDDLLRTALADGDTLRDAASRVAESVGRPRREVYARALRLNR
jgi:16S rRNA (cytidine1402-2'-O)-methyltransferase